METARSWLPFSPAKRGPFSGKGWTLYSGESIMSAFAEGVDKTAPEAADAISAAMSRAQGAMRTVQGSLSVSATGDGSAVAGGHPGAGLGASVVQNNHFAEMDPDVAVELTERKLEMALAGV